MCTETKEEPGDEARVQYKKLENLELKSNVGKLAFLVEL